MSAPIPPVVNLANLLTVARLVLVPVFAVLLVGSAMERPTWRVAACAAFVVASLTDYVDGWIARTWNLVTAFGKVADPIADKALTGTALVLLSAYGHVWWWVTVVILAREWGITGLRLWALRYGVIPASRGGKAKTALQIAAITWYLLPFPPVLAAVGPWLMTLAVLVTVVTGMDYVVRGWRLRRLAPPGRPPGRLSGRLSSGVEPEDSGGAPEANPAASPADTLIAPAPTPAVAPNPSADEPVA